jgi:hypothetical protein
MHGCRLGGDGETGERAIEARLMGCGSGGEVSTKALPNSEDPDDGGMGRMGC